MGFIVNIVGREILDSRGNPTVEADVHLDTGVIGRASVPSGASTGSKEAIELRDSDESGRYNGKGVREAINNIGGEIYECLVGLDSTAQENIDSKLIELDGTEFKKRLGANAMLAVSMAVARASAVENETSLFRYLGGIGQKILPTPMMNIINGGSHANNNIDIQEFMIVPFGFSSVSDSIRCGAEVFQCLKSLLSKRNMSTTVGDEGGFAPNLKGNKAALDLILDSIEHAGFKPGRQVGLALDCASTEFYKNKKYVFAAEKKEFSPVAFSAYLKELVNQYPIISIEDGMAEDDFVGWKLLTDELGSQIQLVGDDLFVTNTKMLDKGIQMGIANAILIKINQIGTLTETYAAIEMAKRAGYGTVISHRSGETEDSFIADLAVASNALQIKTGSLSRTDRLAKYNQLIRIEEELGDCSSFAGGQAFNLNG